MKTQLTKIAVLSAACFGVLTHPAHSQISLGVRPEISNNEVITNLSAETGRGLWYDLWIPEGATNLTIETHGSSGDADLYVSEAEDGVHSPEVTTTNYDRSSQISRWNIETVFVQSPKPGQWGILIYARNQYSGLRLTAKFTDTRKTVEAPIINPGSRTSSGPVTVSISCPTPGATIYYTTDGTDPNGNIDYPNYTIPFVVSSSVTLRARAFKDGMSMSPIVSATYTITLPTVATPVITPGSQTSSGPLTVSMSCPTTGATIYYTTDGGEPTGSSRSFSMPFTLSSSATVKARAFKNGMAASPVVSTSYTITLPAATVATPVISPGSQTLSRPVTVSMSCTTSDATIRYTIDGSDPSGSSTVYPGPFPLSSSTTVKARAFKFGMSSLVAFATYTISQPAITTLVNYVPVDGLNGLETSERVFRILVPSGQVKLEIKTYGGSGDADLYVKPGAVPTLQSYTYSSNAPGNSETVTIPNPSAGDWFIVIRGWSAFSGLTLVASYTGSGPVIATPTISPGSKAVPASGVSVQINCATPGAVIRYTLNGADPNSSSTSYTGAFTVKPPVQVKARAFRSGMTDSQIASAIYSTATTVTPPVTPPATAREALLFTWQKSNGKWRAYGPTQMVNTDCDTEARAIDLARSNPREPVYFLATYTLTELRTGEVGRNKRAYSLKRPLFSWEYDIRKWVSGLPN